MQDTDKLKALLKESWDQLDEQSTAVYLQREEEDRARYVYVYVNIYYFYVISFHCLYIAIVSMDNNILLFP